MAYARSVRYLGSQRGSMLRQVRVLALAPLYGLLYLTILVPIRLWALFSRRKPAWGTRRVVEVEFQGTPTERSPLAHDTTIDGFSSVPARVPMGRDYEVYDTTSNSTPSRSSK